jgi:hypothetical protein
MLFALILSCKGVFWTIILLTTPTAGFLAPELLFWLVDRIKMTDQVRTPFKGFRASFPVARAKRKVIMARVGPRVVTHSSWMDCPKEAYLHGQQKKKLTEVVCCLDLIGRRQGVRKASCCSRRKRATNDVT